MPRMYTGLKLDVDLVAKSFFTSRVFTYGERFLLKYVGLYPEPEFPLVKRFEVGETVYCWKVVDRTEDEILFQWKAAGFRGYTWCSIHVISFQTRGQWPCSPCAEPINMLGAGM